MQDNVLIVIDMQNDFIDGALGSPEALSVTAKVANVIKNFEGEIILTMDTHFPDYLSSNEGRHLPVIHCQKGSTGHEIHESIKALIKEDMKIFEKNSFASLDLANYLKEKKNLSSITLVGICTDICVISNALLLKAFFPETDIKVVETACAGVTTKSHEEALNTMKMCHIDVI